MLVLLSHLLFQILNGLNLVITSIVGRTILLLLLLLLFTITIMILLLLLILIVLCWESGVGDDGILVGGFVVVLVLLF